MMLSENGSPVSLRIADSVVEIMLNRPPANALGMPIIDGLHIGLDAADALARQGHCGVLGAAPASSRPAPTSSTCRPWTRHRSVHMGTLCAAPSSAWPPTPRCRWPPSTGSPWAAVWSWRWRARCVSALRRRGSVCPKSNSASFRAPGAPSACPI